MLSTFPILWAESKYYGESTGIGGLNYISLGLETLVGSNLCAFLNDRMYCLLKARNDDTGKPEIRIPLLSVSVLFDPAGLFIYGWTAQTHQHRIALNIGAFLFAVANMTVFQGMQTYIVDTYTLYAARAQAVVSALRCLATLGFLLFAPYLYNALMYGWDNSLLAFISMEIGISAPILWVEVWLIKEDRSIFFTLHSLK